MCLVCRQHPCHPMCPNAPEPKPVMFCSECGEGIYSGDDYYDIGDGLGICKECIEAKSTLELMELFGEYFSEAS